MFTPASYVFVISASAFAKNHFFEGHEACSSRNKMSVHHHLSEYLMLVNICKLIKAIDINVCTDDNYSDSFQSLGYSLFPDDYRSM